jgi:histidine ammonia-lyase
LHRVIDNVEYILAVELMYAAQGLDFRRPLKSGPVLEACHGLVRSKVTHAAADRIFAADMEALRQLIASGDFVAEADAVAREQGGVLNEGWAMFGLD